jgi:hypothetical protein
MKMTGAKSKIKTAIIMMRNKTLARILMRGKLNKTKISN